MSILFDWWTWNFFCLMMKNGCYFIRNSTNGLSTWFNLSYVLLIPICTETCSFSLFPQQQCSIDWKIYFSISFRSNTACTIDKPWMYRFIALSTYHLNLHFIHQIDGVNGNSAHVKIVNSYRRWWGCWFSSTRRLYNYKI